LQGRVTQFVETVQPNNGMSLNFTIYRNLQI
jgi:hypothetical protein